MDKHVANIQRFLSNLKPVSKMKTCQMVSDKHPSICHNWQLLRSKSAHFRGGWVTFSANFRWKGTSPPNQCWYQKTRVFFLPHSEDRVILCSFVWRVPACDRRTDRQRDRRNCCRYYSALHCRQCGRAVKIYINGIYTTFCTEHLTYTTQC